MITILSCTKMRDFLSSVTGPLGTRVTATIAMKTNTKLTLLEEQDCLPVNTHYCYHHHRMNLARITEDSNGLTCKNHSGFSKCYPLSRIFLHIKMMARPLNICLHPFFMMACQTVPMNHNACLTEDRLSHFESPYFGIQLKNVCPFFS